MRRKTDRKSKIGVKWHSYIATSSHTQYALFWNENQSRSVSFLRWNADHNFYYVGFWRGCFPLSFTDMSCSTYTTFCLHWGMFPNTRNFAGPRGKICYVYRNIFRKKKCRLWILLSFLFLFTNQLPNHAKSEFPPSGLSLQFSPIYGGRRTASQTQVFWLSLAALIPVC